MLLNVFHVFLGGRPGIWKRSELLHWTRRRNLCWKHLQLKKVLRCWKHPPRPCAKLFFSRGCSKARGCSSAVSNSMPNSKPVGGSPRVTELARSGGRVQHLFGEHCCISKICWCPWQRAFLCEKAWDFCQYHGLWKLDVFDQVQKWVLLACFYVFSPSQGFWSQRISHKLTSHVFYRLKVRPSGKRPNYDNSNRRLMAKPIHREKWQGYVTGVCLQTLFFVLVMMFFWLTIWYGYSPLCFDDDDYDDGGDDGDDDNDDKVDHPGRWRVVAFCVFLLTTLTHAASQSHYVALRFGSRGASSFRLQHLASLPHCRCHRRVCFQQLTPILRALKEFLRIFWKMPKHWQDQYLVQVLKQGEETKTWFLLGTRLSFKCIIAILGMGKPAGGTSKVWKTRHAFPGLGLCSFGVWI